MPDTRARRGRPSRSVLAACALAVMTPSATRAEPEPQAQPVLLFTIGMHVEPFGAKVSALVPGAPRIQPPQQPTYRDPAFFARQLADVKAFVSMVERHAGRMTVQAQTPFSSVLGERRETLLKDLAARGHEIGLHFHEDAHLGRASGTLPDAVWCAVLKEETDFLRRAGAPAIRYWSGGNLYPRLLSAASCAGLSVNSDWKSPQTQTTARALLGVNPWRPAGGTDGVDVSAFARHDPEGKAVFLPEGLFSRTDFASMRRAELAGGDAAYFDFLAGELEHSLAGARVDRVNVFHVTVHPGEFRGAPGEKPFAVVDRWLTSVVDPLVASGKVRWATFGEMSDAYVAWERANPGVDPRGGLDPRPKMSFVVNVHDFTHLDESAETLLRLTDVFVRHGVKGDFYLTGPMVALYAGKRPDVLARLFETRMTISTHVRPPHPLVDGFTAPLKGLSGEELARTLRDYETYGLDLATGGLVRSEKGGFSLVSASLGSAPITVSAPVTDGAIKDAALDGFRAMGAQACVVYHESGTDPDQPFDWREGLLVRPSDFSVTRWKAGDVEEDAFWWNMLGSRWGDEYVPLGYLERQLAAWDGRRPPFVTSLIHENNFGRSGPEGWTSIYYEGSGKSRVPRTPPFDLDAKDPSRPRPEAEREAIWKAYEEMVAWASRTMQVVTSRDVVAMAGEAPAE